MYGMDIFTLADARAGLTRDPGLRIPSLIENDYRHAFDRDHMMYALSGATASPESDRGLIATISALLRRDSWAESDAPVGPLSTAI